MDYDIYFMARSQHLVAIQVVCLVVALIAHRRFRNRSRLSGRTDMLHQHKVRGKLLHNFSTSGKCGKRSSKCKKRKLEKLEKENACSSTIMSAINNVANALDRNTKVIESSRPHVYSEVEIFRELELMCLGPDDLANAYLFLVERPEKARALFGCPSPMRMTILEKMMHTRE